MDTEKLRRQLIDRITENYSEYRANLLLKDRQELIDGAGRIPEPIRFGRDRPYETFCWMNATLALMS